MYKSTTAAHNMPACLRGSPADGSLNALGSPPSQLRRVCRAICAHRCMQQWTCSILLDNGPGQCSSFKTKLVLTAGSPNSRCTSAMLATAARPVAALQFGQRIAPYIPYPSRHHCPFPSMHVHGGLLARSWCARARTTPSPTCCIILPHGQESHQSEKRWAAGV